jgi:uncharacterized protein with ParB-like and HNH nuclease domain
MGQFFDIGITVMTFLAALATLGLLNEKKEERSYGLVTFAFLLFISTFTLVPYMQYNKAIDSVRVFNIGKSLECISNQNNFGSIEKFLVNNKNWKVKEYEFVRDDGLMVMAHKCEE